MAFELRVTFSGLNLVVHRREPHPAVVILTPDARGRDAIRDEAGFCVEPPAEEHAAYLRFDLNALADKPLPTASGRSPDFEVVHQLNREELVFENLPTDGAEAQAADVDERPVDPPELLLPDLSTLATDAGLAPALLGDGPPASLLARAVLHGGKWFNDGPREEWVIDSALGGERGAVLYDGPIVGSFTWRRIVEADTLRIRLRSLDDRGAEGSRFELRPASSEGQPVIDLKIANLCAHDPLEWSVFPERPVEHDVDFKWLYRLLQYNDGTPYCVRVRGADLPHPHRKHTTAGVRGGGGCTTSRIAHNFVLPHETQEASRA